ncbi:hypothetical protein SDC9_143715 [bioreactor metagenome]|uniref:Uncharacterized protein n=1 Tax=bioreactor metagenome TaxID=1076179 RepID=A0A645E4P5_9ZZZZ
MFRLFKKLCFLRGVNLHRSFHGFERDALLPREEGQRLGVLREAAAAVSHTRLEELRADTGIVPHALRHVVDVCADKLAEVRDVVHIRNLEREKVVASIFDHLRRAARDRNNRQIKRGVDLLKHLFRRFILRTDDDARGMHRVVHGIPLRQKLRVARNADLHVPHKVVLDELLHLVVSADRDGGFHDNEAIVDDALRNLAANLRNIAQICAAIRLFRRTDADEDRVRFRIGGLIIARETQPFRRDILFEQFFQPRFIDRRHAGSHQGNLLLVHIHAGD